MTVTKTSTPSCQYHGFHWFRFTGTAAERADLLRSGWRDTVRFGWVCPTCLAKHPIRFAHLKDRVLKGRVTP